MEETLAVGLGGDISTTDTVHPDRQYRASNINRHATVLFVVQSPFQVCGAEV
eukprot:m.1684917 g.1684917  ORF g.1684917 m.1684917 type:complete len:52 (-) comp248552_c0_seq1:111-266(-)